VKITRRQLSQMILEVLKKDWQDTSWKTDDGSTVTIGQVIDYLGDEMFDINVLELSQQIPGLFDDEYLQSPDGGERVDATRFGEYQTDEMGEKTWVWFPVIIVEQDGQYQYVLDGNHRLQKAIDNDFTVRALDRDYKTIKAKILDVSSEETPEVFKQLFG